jgi:hypothetical protein
MGLKEEELLTLVEMGFQHAFCPAAERREARGT